jgi:RNA polymerase sigma-70 factor (ECF subfamily)
MKRSPATSAQAGGSATATAHDRELLAALSERFRGVLMRYFERQVRESEDTEDMVQEVFVRLLRRRDLAAIDSPEGYLFETAASVVRDRARKRIVRHAQDHESYEESVHAVEDASLERVSMDREALQVVIRALQELPERTRAVFVLHRMEELRQSELARRLGISVSAVEKHMIKAVAYLMEKVGLDRPESP